MNDNNDLFTENNGNNNSPDNSDNGSSIQTASGVTETTSDASNGDAPKAEKQASEKRVPAATANSYRDIIAERLAAKKAADGGGGGASAQERSERPAMAHAGGWQDRPERTEREDDSSEQPEPRIERAAPSEFKLTRKPELDAAAAIAITDAAAGVTMSTTDSGADMPNSIEAATQSMEIDAPPSVGGTSSRDRARQRQKERAELRRGGRPERNKGFEMVDADRVQSTDEQEATEDAVETSMYPIAHSDVDDLIAHPETEALRTPAEELPERQSRDQERERRTRDRAPRTEREPREPRGDRPEREPRPERAEREARPERGERPERAERPERSERPERGPRPDREPRESREGRPEREPREAREPREGRSERPERSERGERPERRERGERSEREPREGRERGERSERGERPERRERPERAEGSQRLEGREGRSGTALERRGRIDHPERESGARESTPRESSTKILDSLKGGIPETNDRSVNSSKALASRVGISAVIPLYNEQESLRELTAALKAQLFKLAGPRHEIIYVNDGSTDKSGDILNDIMIGTSRVSTITFRRNMGKSPALAAGFKEAKYGIVVTMDADLQDDPRELPNMIAKLEEGYDLVSGWKKKRHDPVSKTAPSKFFNSVTSFFSGIKLHDFNCGFKAYRKEVTDALDVYGEMHRYLPALAHWKGFRVTEVPVVHHPRKFGKSKFGGSRFFKGFLDLMTIVFTNRYGRRPLHLFGTVGTILALVGFFIDAWVSVEWIMGTPLSNRPILQLGILLILVGVQLISLGLLGEMIVKNTTKTTDVSVVKERSKRSSDDRREVRTTRLRRPVRS